MGIQLDADLSHAVPGTLIVANHISWVDIFVINAALPSAFVSKEEVRHWPLIGWLAAKCDTVFLRRGSRGHAKIINGQIAEILGKGNDVAVFPEGTTTDGTHLLHFHGALIQPALAAGRPVLPVAISYWGGDGNRSLDPAYVGDVTLAQCTLAIVRGQWPGRPPEDLPGTRSGGRGSPAGGDAGAGSDQRRCRPSTSRYRRFDTLAELIFKRQTTARTLLVSAIFRERLGDGSTDFRFIDDDRKSVADFRRDG